jgi:hypothetical protein
MKISGQAIISQVAGDSRELRTGTRYHTERKLIHLPQSEGSQKLTVVSVYLHLSWGVEGLHMPSVCLDVKRKGVTGKAVRNHVSIPEPGNAPPLKVEMSQTLESGHLDPSFHSHEITHSSSDCLTSVTAF